jgi:hypothetical protein
MLRSLHQREGRGPAIIRLSGVILGAVTLGAVALGAVTLTPRAARAASPPLLEVDPSSGRPGYQLAVVATGLDPGSTATFLWGGSDGTVALGSSPADETGTAALSFDIPGDASVGDHLVELCVDPDGCPPGAIVAQAAVSVLPPPGSDLGWVPLLILALAALWVIRMTTGNLRHAQETFKPPPRKRHDHELDLPPEPRSRTDDD